MSLSNCLNDFPHLEFAANTLGSFGNFSYRCETKKNDEFESFVFLHLCYTICICFEMYLIEAVQANNLERVRLLVEQGADKDKDKGDGNSWTPLYWASLKGHFEVTQYLVGQGATLDKADNDGWTPLIAAANRGHLEVTRYLLEQGADRDKANNDGYTPLHIAAVNGHLEIAMLLMSYGADLNARTKYGELPIDMGYHNTEEIKQAFRDEPRRRMDHGHKRATEQDRHPDAATPASAQQEGDEEEEKEEQSIKRPRLNDEGVEAVVAEMETKVAEEDEDSEPSDEEDV